MRVIFMGTPDFAVGTLEALIESGYEVVLVVTQPDKPQGRKMELMAPPVKNCAISHDIPVFQPKRVREPEALAQIKAHDPDLIVVAAFGQLLPKELLDMPKFGCINVHASLLPKYRGAAPIQWSILNGDETTGVTIMRMDVGLDTGDMIAKVEIPIGEEDTGGTLFDKLAQAGAKLCVDTIPSIVDGSAVYTPQDESLATKVGMIKKSDGQIDFTRSAKQIVCQIRGLNPWPSAFTSLRGKTLKIWSAKAVASTGTAAPGTVIAADKKQLLVQTKDGALSLQEVQLEGKKRMAIEDFLRGVNVEEGECLGV
ncbi:MAG: methionyl-tRNA formyltransferase [bacterium]|nr:methionyl-tRNA formyltransferase [bacterium]